MKTWLLSVVGIVFLSILFDLIYPSGKTNKFCKSIFGIIAIGVILSPILNLNFSGIDGSYWDEQLVANINKSKAEVYAREVEYYLEREGFSRASVEVDYTLSENDFCVNFIYVDTSNVVLRENLTNINKYEVIAEKVSNQFDISEERVLVYG